MGAIDGGRRVDGSGEAPGVSPAADALAEAARFPALQALSLIHI